ncbi:hypothetical protein IMZ29_00720 [Achromobacter sp. GG226]|uniref:hypothetical protein n=1 Tax=Verticiella alkaliphila TaxID=2779529 RepID=UPI001C0CE3AC|nr:hypothetical protein [Verticiella sp. GG226]MBU4609125.1 hypothetical protein [Verticiella sp. GG226]
MNESDNDNDTAILDEDVTQQDGGAPATPLEPAQPGDGGAGDGDPPDVIEEPEQPDPEPPDIRRFAIVADGTVVNVTEADLPYGEAQGWIESDTAGIGWLYADGEFTPPEPQPEPVPQACTRRQGRLALLQAGHLDAVEDAIAAITDPTERRAAQIEYEADTWQRSNQFLISMWAHLGGTEAELDDLFRTAVTL